MNRRFLCIKHHQELETFSIVKLSRNIVKLIGREFFLLSKFFLPCLSLCNINACITTSFLVTALFCFQWIFFIIKQWFAYKNVFLQIHNSIGSLVLISLVAYAVLKLVLFKFIFAALGRLGSDLNLLHFSL